MITLSIVIPAFNVADYITGTLDSVLSQNSPRVEVILTDDGATDNTVEVAQAAIARHGATNAAMHRKENGGVSSARNFGMDRAQGEYVLFLDGDDYLAPGFIQTFLDLVDAHSPDILHWPYDLVDEQGAVVTAFPYPEPLENGGTGLRSLEAVLLQRATRIWTCSISYRRQLLKDHGLRHTEGCRVGEDLEFIYKALSHAQSVLFAPDLKTLYLQRASSVMSTYSIRKFDAVEAMERTRDYLANLPGEGFARLTRHFDQHEIFHYYTGSYRLCLQYQTGVEKMVVKAAIRQLNQDLDQQYPGLRDRMTRQMAGRQRGAMPDRVDMFRLSPAWYLRLSQWSDKLRGIKQP